MSFETSDKSTRSDRQTGAKFIAAFYDGQRLLIVCDQLLDPDIQPSPEDFSLLHNGLAFDIRAAVLKSPMQEGSSYSVISLLPRQVLPHAAHITIRYQPKDFLLWSLDEDQALSPFELSTELNDMSAVEGLKISLPDFDDFDVLNDSATGLADTPPSVTERAQTLDELLSPEPLAHISLALGHCVQIGFQQELDFAVQPRVEDFRAELEDQWLHINAAYLTRPEPDSWPELWLVLEEDLHPGSRLRVQYRAPGRSLCYRGGQPLRSFATPTVCCAEDVDTAAPGPAVMGGPKPGPDLSDVDQQAAPLDSAALVYADYVDELLGMTRDEAALPAAAPGEPGVVAEESADAASPTATDDSRSGQATAAEPLSTMPAEPPVTVGYGTAHDSQPPLPQFDKAQAVDKPQAGDQPPREAAIRLAQAGPADDASSAASVAPAAPQPQTDGVQHRTLLDRVLTIVLVLSVAVVLWVLLMLVYITVDFFQGPEQEVGREPGAAAVQQHSDSEAAVLAADGACSVALPGGRYEGECVAGVPQGEGLFIASSGKRIKGQWYQGKAHGKASIYWPNGTSYEGDMRYGVQDGQGILRYKTGDMYEGGFKANLKHGQGIMQWASGARYKGAYVDGKANGEGRYWRADGAMFEGLFKDGMATQQGQCTLPNGEHFAGPCP